MVLFLLSCVTEPLYFDPPGRDTGSPNDSAGPTVDEDGDGFSPWSGEGDPALADCDDQDPDVTPASERVVPEGWFLRGAPKETRDIFVSSFCVQVNEVTVQEFLVFLEAMQDRGLDNVDEEGNELYDFDDDDDDFDEYLIDEEGVYTVLPGYEQHPITEVWFHSAERYCAWAGRRLPTDAEWEKAMRGDQDARVFPWGEDELTCDWANTNLGLEGEGENLPCQHGPVAVGQYPHAASPYGAVDGIGNVAEWVSDWWHPDYAEEGTDQDPTGAEEPYTHPDKGWNVRITRGGSHASGLYNNNVYEQYLEPDWATSNGVGLRCVRPI